MKVGGTLADAMAKGLGLFDGTTVTMPDTLANQAAYPQVDNQGPGLGFPIARLGAVISLACGAVVSLGFSRYAGKGRARSACCAGSGACSPPATSCWPTG